MKNILIIAVVTALTGCAMTSNQATTVALEFRPGSESPGPGLTEMTVQGSDQVVYISDEVVLSNVDVQSARMASGPSGPQIELVFTKAGAEKFAAATEKNIRKPLGILIDHQLISAPIVMDKITGGQVTIAGNFTEDEAQHIADQIYAH